ncbi:MAG: restriction endonuclease subunit M [Christensenellaceae bacterium]|nr:restriction endonuclease subunit M [Christensenellaceae bacterium]
MSNMEEFTKIDFLDNRINDLNEEVLNILLKDMTTQSNIMWCTDNYEGLWTEQGENPFLAKSQIQAKYITGELYNNIIKPRIRKRQADQRKRVKEKAEVFTPSWICNEQNNSVDACYLKQENSFNIATDKTWSTNPEKVDFSKSDRTWQEYVLSNRLEITCGEAPYICSIYDTVTGQIIPLKDRIGLLDRKFRIVGENVADDNEWLSWAIKALQSIYGYEWQGDSLLIARENVFYSFMEYYHDRFKKLPDIELQKEVADIISWNFWQMDGLKCVIPESCSVKRTVSYMWGNEILDKICDGCRKNEIKRHDGIYCKIKDWQALNTPGEIVRFVDLIKD